MKMKKEGFTLIELLVVIAIIAVLSVVVILTLNPAELLRKSRDSNRISDLATVKTAVNIYLADIAAPAIGTPTTCYVQQSNAGTMVVGTTNVYEFASNTTESASLVTYPFATSTGAVCGQWFRTAAFTVASTSSSITTGWIPVNLQQINSGPPIGQWPVDPTWSTGQPCLGSGCNGNAGHFYSYIPSATGNSFKIAAKMESASYSGNGANDMETKDGGTDINMFEQGNDLSL